MTTKILILLRALILNWPIIRSLGFFLSAPLLILVPDVTYKNRLKTALTLYEPINIGLYDKEDSEIFGVHSSEPVFVDVSSLDSNRSSRAFERLELILSATQGFIGQLTVDCFPLLISTGGIPNLLKGRVCVLPLSLERADVEPLDLTALVPSPSDFGLIKSRVVEDALYAEVPPALLAAAYCCHPYIESETEANQIRELREVAKYISDRSNSFDDYEGLTELFMAEFYEWLNGDNPYFGCILPDISSEAYMNMARTFFFQKDFVYIDQALFEKIAINTITAVGLNALKSALESSGVLVSEKGARNSRMYFRYSGKLEGKRMLKLNLSSLERPEEPLLFDLCFREGGNIDE